MPAPTLTGTADILMDGVAAFLAAHDVGDYTDPYTPHAADAGTVIDLKTMSDQFDRCVCLTAFRITAYPDRARDQWQLQIRSRGARDDNLDGDRLGDQCFDLVQGLTYVSFGPVTIDQVLFKYSAPMGIDEANRTERSDNYVLDLTPAPTVLRP